MSFSGSTASGKTGGAYTKSLYLYKDAANVDAKPDVISDDELSEHIQRLPEIDQKIIEVSVYKSKLIWWTLTNLWWFHAFVILKTKTWWWSIEKNSEGVTVQRAKSQETVINFLRGKKRTQPVEFVKKAEGKLSVVNLIDHIYKENLLKNPYNYMKSNCKHFAGRTFELANDDTFCTVGPLNADLPHPITVNYRRELEFLIVGYDNKQALTDNKKTNKQLFFENLETDRRFSQEILEVRCCIIDNTSTVVELKADTTNCFISKKELESGCYMDICFSPWPIDPKQIHLVLNQCEGKGTIKSLFNHLNEIEALNLPEEVFSNEVFNYCKKEN